MWQREGNDTQTPEQLKYQTGGFDSASSSDLCVSRRLVLQWYR